MSEKQQKNKTESTEDKSSIKETLMATVLILILLGVIVLLYFVALRYNAEKYHVRAIEALNTNDDIERAQQLERKAVDLAGFEDRYHRALSRLYFVQLSKVANDEELSQTKKRNKFQNLINDINQQVQLAKRASPRNVTNWSNQGVIYQGIMDYGVEGADKMAIKGYQRAIELAPANPELYLQLARTYIAKADVASRKQQSDSQKQQKQQSVQQNLEQAMNYLEKALEKKPNYWSAHYQQAIVYDRQGKIDKAVRKLNDLKQVYPEDQSIPFQLGLLYWRDEELDKAEQKFKRTLELNSSFANARYFLGLVYDDQGQKRKAIKQFEKIASLNKKNKKQVEPILKNLRAGRAALGKAPEEMPELEEGTATSSAATSTEEVE